MRLARFLSEGNQQFTTSYGRAFYEKEFNAAFETTKLPERPDYERANAFLDGLKNLHQLYWGGRGKPGYTAAVRGAFILDGANWTMRSSGLHICRISAPH